MATKIKTVFFCQSCGYESSNWMGQCPGCREWNSFVEETVEERKGAATKKAVSEARLSKLSEITVSDTERTLTGMEELDREMEDHLLALRKTVDSANGTECGQQIKLLKKLDLSVGLVRSIIFHGFSRK